MSEQIDEIQGLIETEIDATEILDEHQSDVVVPIRNRGNTITKYKITEMNGDEYDRWMKLQASAVKISANGKVDTTHVKGVMDQQLACSMKQMDGKSVPLSTIQGWGTKLKNILVGRCEAHNGLTKRAEEREGKD